ncbi:MAG: hypothetical protein H6734_27955 [Alphaproteobacteria bacterium]|nr:hypothetical protein [Alphaproteobacteria bacterium]
MSIIVGCGSTTGEELVELTTSDGQACLYGEGGADWMASDTTFVADGPTEVLVTFEECASGCASEVTASCEATLEGDQVVVTGSASYVVPGGNPTCVAMCVVVQATCDGPTLPAGSYPLVWGSSGDVAVVPSAGEVPCAP